MNDIIINLPIIDQKENTQLSNKKTRRSRNRNLAFNPSSPAHLYLNSLAKNSKKTMERALDAIAKFLGEQIEMPEVKYLDDINWTMLHRHHVHNIVNKLVELDKSPSTVALYLSAIKGVMKEAWLSEMIVPDQYHRIAAIKRPKGSRVRKGKALCLKTANKPLSACNDNTITGIRDKAILSILLGAGLRRDECANLRMQDIDISLSTITVIGKGNKERIVPVGAYVVDCIFNWVNGVRGEHDGPLFLPIRKNGSVGETALSESSIYLICKNRAKKAGVEDFKPHNLRRTYGTEHDKKGTPLKTTCDLLGHASLDTTRTYIFDDSENNKKVAVSKVNFFDV